ncbi:MAG: phosphatase PAP2 family protein [Lachnospiraceae bacterium]|nr:phosphatase PAP2 family protein [Lachnospiraceae bacterium]
MKRIRTWITAIVPEYGLIPVIFAFVFNTVIYAGAQVVTGSWYHHNIESRLDGMIPFIPQTLSIYLGCYVFWIVNYILIARQDKKSVYQFFAGDMLSRIICLVCFLLYPTTNVRPEIVGNGFWEQAMRALYSIDGATNLFPSIHCLVSWFCVIGIRGRKEIPRVYRWLSCVMAIAVFVSTLTTKQHVIVDVLGGIVLAEVCLMIGKHTVIAKWYGKVFDRCTALLFGYGSEKTIEEQKENYI